MKNLILTVTLATLCSVSFAGSCENGSCRKPVRGAVSGVVSVTERVVTAPVRVVRKVVTNSRCRRCR